MPPAAPSTVPTISPGSLAEFLRAFNGPLIARWCQRVLADPAVPEANRLEMLALQDHIPDLIARLIVSLERHTLRTGEHVGREIGAEDESRAHAHARFLDGYKLPSALRELSHLRSAIMDMAADHGVPVSGEEAMLVHAAVDEAMAVAAGEIHQAAQATVQREAEFREHFLAIVGHDLRQPLGAVSFSAEMLLRHDSLGGSERRAVQRIATSAQRMERLVSDLLDLVRTRQGVGLHIVPRPVDLAEICRHVVDEVAAANPTRVLEFVAAGDCQGHWDPDRLGQLASNLITNAVSYSPGDTPVRVSVAAADATTVRLDVHNLGEPIPAELLPVLFDAFRRGSRGGTSRGTAGLGLGLHIAASIAEAHGGRIEVRSTAADGTSFCATLPRGGQDASATR